MAGVILTVTPNPAVDVTYHLDELRPGTVHRVDDVVSRAGGKGINVARVLQQLGVASEAVLLGLRRQGRADRRRARRAGGAARRRWAG